MYPTETLSRRLDVPVPVHILQLAATLDAGGTPVMCGDHRCIVPFQELQVCEHVRRKHRSNHQYAVIHTGTLMWKLNCHSCADQISAWRVFPSMESVEAAFCKQCIPYTATADAPAVKDDLRSQADIYDLQSHGPPPSVAAGTSVMCIDGVYVA